jgi:hypothetical protein
VGLLEGDGYIRSVHRGNLEIIIELKALPKNIAMLSLIKNYIGGRIYSYKKTNKYSDGTTFNVDTVKWNIKSKKGIVTCLEIFKKYPLLTSNKICLSTERSNTTCRNTKKSTHKKKHTQKKPHA